MSLSDLDAPVASVEPCGEDGILVFVDLLLERANSSFPATARPALINECRNFSEKELCEFYDLAETADPGLLDEIIAGIIADARAAQSDGASDTGSPPDTNAAESEQTQNASVISTMPSPYMTEGTLVQYRTQNASVGDGTVFTRQAPASASPQREDPKGGPGASPVEEDADTIRDLGAFYPPDEVSFFNAQVWHNPSPKAGQSEWAVKLRPCRVLGDEADQFAPKREHVLYFAQNSRSFRNNIAKMMRSKKISPNFRRQLAALPWTENTRLAVLQLPVRGKFEKTPEGKSSRQLRAFNGHYAQIELNPAGTAPVRLTLHFNSDWQAVIDKFNVPVEARSDKAPGWTALFDPAHLYGHAKRLQAHQKAGKKWEAYDSLLPFSRLLNALQDSHDEDMRQMKSKLALLEGTFDYRAVTRMEAEVRDLTRRVNDLTRKNTKLEDDLRGMILENVHLARRVGKLEDLLRPQVDDEAELLVEQAQKLSLT